MNQTHAQLPGHTTPDATVWTLDPSKGLQIGAFWSVERQCWEVLEVAPGWLWEHATGYPQRFMAEVSAMGIRAVRLAELRGAGR